MTAIVERSGRDFSHGGAGVSPASDDRARNRFAAHRVAAAARADVSVQESQALSRAAACAPHQLRRKQSDLLPLS